MGDLPGKVHPPADGECLWSCSETMRHKEEAMIDVMLNWFRTVFAIRTQRLPRRAATMLEYVLIAGVVLAVAAGIFVTFKGTLKTFFSGANSQVGTATSVAP